MIDQAFTMLAHRFMRLKTPQELGTDGGPGAVRVVAVLRVLVEGDTSTVPHDLHDGCHFNVHSGTSPNSTYLPPFPKRESAHEVKTHDPYQLVRNYQLFMMAAADSRRA